MPKKLTQEQFWQLYKKLPEELKEALSSSETAEAINNICETYKISNESAPLLVGSVRDVLLGILLPNEFQNILEKEVKLEPDVAKKVAQEINRFIFYPVKASLEELYKVPITPPPAAPKVTPPAEEKPERPSAADVYREAIE